VKKIILSSLLLTTSILYSGVASAASTQQYTASNDDTFWKISQKFHVNLHDLIAANPNVRADNIYQGIFIHIPTSNSATLLSSNQTSTSWESKADAIIATGKTQLGTPYVFGGDKPNIAFDCSGFVQYVFNKNGFNLPHSAAMISTIGTPVSRDQLRKGDLVFLANTYTSGVSHVGIYLGNNQVLHASTSGETKCVKITTFFGSPYYEEHYWGARRLIN
jgi:cell wall-associated NlpC family hydrolase